MSDISYEFERFSSREGFNRSLMHFKAVSAMLGDIESSVNLADVLNQLLADKEIEQVQLGPIVYALLVDKYGYAFRSFNMEETLEDFSYIAQEIRKWNSVDMVVTYFHPELGLIIINPKNPSHWEKVNAFKKNEIVTIYAGVFADIEKVKDKKLFDVAIGLFVDYLRGKKGAGPAKLKSGKYKYKELIPKAAPKASAPVGRGRAARTTRAAGRGTVASTAPAIQPRFGAAQSTAAVQTHAAAAAPAAPAAAPAEQTGAKRMTPFYSVPVTNELFHNGNVEAWKKIIQSYTTKYPGSDVYVFYDGERIHDIHALFKWGKVKHGSTILFAVTGENIQDVAKLQRYLRQGASPRFEDFLKFPVNTVLKLF